MISPLIADPIGWRVNLIEMWTIMSDYRKAYHFAHGLVLDMRAA